MLDHLSDDLLFRCKTQVVFWEDSENSEKNLVQKTREIQYNFRIGVYVFNGLSMTDTSSIYNVQHFKGSGYLICPMFLILRGEEIKTGKLYKDN